MVTTGPLFFIMKQEFLRNGLALDQDEHQFGFSTDAMVLADFAGIPPGSSVMDLCAGSGAVGFLLLSREPTLQITALELQQAPWELARQNARRNGLDGQFQAVKGDVRAIRTLFGSGSFSHVVCNPPYFPVNAGLPDREEAFALSRTELACTLDDVCSAASWLLRGKGCFYLVHRPQRMADLICSLRQTRLEPKILRLVQHRPGAAPSLVLIKAVKDGRPGLEVPSPLILRGTDNAPTEDYLRIYGLQPG